jgi:predicted MFS family arabinose efflux permease
MNGSGRVTEAPLPADYEAIMVPGASLGTVVAMPLCGLVLNAWGWDAVFYVSGALALMWFVAWWLLVFDTPDKHPRISREERQYLKENLTVQDNDRVTENEN